jgi:hypothetical protein
MFMADVGVGVCRCCACIRTFARVTRLGFIYTIMLLLLAMIFYAGGAGTKLAVCFSRHRQKTPFAEVTKMVLTNSFTDPACRKYYAPDVPLVVYGTIWVVLTICFLASVSCCISYLFYCCCGCYDDAQRPRRLKKRRRFYDAQETHDHHIRNPHKGRRVSDYSDYSSSE